MMKIVYPMCLRPKKPFLHHLSHNVLMPARSPGRCQRPRLDRPTNNTSASLHCDPAAPNKPTAELSTTPPIHSGAMLH